MSDRDKGYKTEGNKMGLIQIEKNDVIATKEGQTIRVMAVYMNGDVLSRIEGVDDSEASPMRRPVFANQIARILRKALKSDGLKAQESAEQKAGA
jgi:hypothetical protein